jgi:cation:H+ antiporter
LAVEILGVGILIAALLLILISCEVFVNGIEWLGCRLGLAETATGSILAAVGTAMPETIIPLIAIFLGSAEEGEKIGEGAILGAPFMLGTLAMFVGGVAIWYGCRKGKRKECLVLKAGHAERDLKFFMSMYMVALVCGLMSFQDFFDHSLFNLGAALLLMSLYVIYIRQLLKDESDMSEGACPALYLGRAMGIAPAKDTFGMAMILLQVFGALIGIIVGARFFVEEVEMVSAAVGIAPMILAFLIAPIATELPEKFNSVIWYLRGKDTLALGNITGAMVFQSSFPVSIGLLFTEWALDPINIASMVIALVAAFWIYYSVKVKKRVEYKTLLASGSLYVLYIIMLIIFPVAVD